MARGRAWECRMERLIGLRVVGVPFVVVLQLWLFDVGEP